MNSGRGEGKWIKTDLKTGEETDVDLTSTMEDALVPITSTSGKKREFLNQKVGNELMTFSFADNNNVITANACRIN